MKNNKIVDKKQDTCLRLYGNKGYNNIEKIKMTKIKKGLQIPDNLIHDYSLCRRKCSNYINKNRNYLLEKWNGYDYYDNEYIKDYLEYDQKHKFYPTIDHKISVLYGFINKIPLDVINSENNLCFTKRCINSSKGSTCS